MYERTTLPDWFTDFVDAIDTGDAEYYHCEACGAKELPPRNTCPECGSTTLLARSLPEEGTVVTFTEISTTIEKFDDESPYTVVVVELAEGLRLTGQLRGGDGVGIGDEVTVGIERREDREDIVTFEPA